MGYWITDKGGVIQGNRPNVVITETNQLFNDNGTVYLIPRNTCTDNYSIPLGINKSKYDSRPSHLHDIGCYYHQVIVVDIPLELIYRDYIYLEDNRARCKDIPKEYLKVIPVTFNECNDLLLKGMDSISNIPKFKCKLYRLAVNFNINWLNTGKYNIDLDSIYNNKLLTYNI